MSVACVGFGTNLAIQFINLGMHARGTSAALIGFSTMMQALGIVLAAPLAPSLMRRIGIRHTIVAGAMLSAMAMLSFVHAADFIVVTLMRVLYAAGLALVFTCAEFLMLASAQRETRGLSAGLYSTVLGLGMAAGPLCISVFGTDSETSCYLGVAACLACVPAAALAIPPSCPLYERRTSWRLSLLGLSPLALGAAFTFGFLDNGPVSLLGVYGMQRGWPAAHAAVLVSVVTIGAVLCQVPIGWAVDKYDSRLVFGAGGLLATLLLLTLPHVWFAPVLVLMCAVALGAIMEGLYTVGLADVGKRDDGTNLSGANACFVMVCGAGEVVGPLLTGLAIN